jgi:hypothetical protein
MKQQVSSFSVFHSWSTVHKFTVGTLFQIKLRSVKKEQEMTKPKLFVTVSLCVFGTPANLNITRGRLNRQARP